MTFTSMLLRRSVRGVRSVIVPQSRSILNQQQKVLRLQQRRISTNDRRLASLEAFPSQLDDPAATAFLSSSKSAPKVPQTIIEKIVQKSAVGLPNGKFVRSGDYVTIKPARCMTHDNSAAVLNKYRSIGATKIHDPQQLVFTLDHDVQNFTPTNIKKYQTIEAFAKTHGIDFHAAGTGIGHQHMVEGLYSFPGTMAVASDSHSNMYGGIGCLGTPVVRTDACSIWGTGQTWWQVPPIAKVTFTGVLPKGTTGKDVIIALCGLFNQDQVLNHAIEFTGSEETMRSLPVDDRLAISNMTTEFGALAGLFPVDAILKAWLRSKATELALYESADLSASNSTHSPASTRINHAALDQLFENPITSDKGAVYAKTLTLDLSTLCPYISGPNSVKVATPLYELETLNMKIDKAYLVSCTNSRRSDIAAAARVFKEAAASNGGVIPKVAGHVKFYISAASLAEQQAAEEQGDWQALLAAGAQPLPSGCGPCIGLGTGLLEPGEVGISASNRNFKGRMGSPDAKAYLASPEVVAASALAGKFAGPGWYEKPAGWAGVVAHEGEPVEELAVEDTLENLINKFESIIDAGFGAVPSSSTTAESATESSTEILTDVLEGFPEKVSGEIVFCDADNVNTDAIYPGKYTYQDDVTPDKMAEVCMENYDPTFSQYVKKGDILVSGFNFGCGSSREQAATAILAKDIPLVVAGSFGNIFSRNSINNALMGLEVPKLIERLRESFSSQDKQLSRRTGWTLEWDVRRSQVTIEEANGEKWTQKVGSLPPNVQEIIARGGLENWVKAEIANSL